MKFRYKSDVNPELVKILGGQRIKSIQRGGEDGMEGGWDTWGTEERLEYAMKLASAMNQAAAVLQDERDELYPRVKLAEARQAAANLNVSKMTETLQEAITISNAKRQDDLLTIKELRAKVGTDHGHLH